MKLRAHVARLKNRVIFAVGPLTAESATLPRAAYHNLAYQDPGIVMVEPLRRTQMRLSRREWEPRGACGDCVLRMGVRYSEGSHCHGVL